MTVLRGEEKTAWEIYTIHPSGGQEHFLSNSFWEG